MEKNKLTELTAIENIQQSKDNTSAEYLLSKHDKLIHHYARKYTGQYLNYDDLIQEGRIAMIHAAKKFDTSKKVKFITYASYWIRQAMSRYIDQHTKLLRLPQHHIDQLRKTKQTVHPHVQSLDFENEDKKMLILPSKEIDPHQLLLKNTNESYILSLLQQLDPFHQELLFRYYGFSPYHEHSLSDLSKLYHMPKKKIDTIIKHQLLILNSKMKGKL